MIGRKEEIKKIELLLASEKSEFLAVTGRRRVGKTFLIDSLLRDYYCFSMTGIQNGTTQQQLLNFGVKLADFDQFASPEKPENWQRAFIQLRNYLKRLDTNRKQVIFIDELPWVATHRSNFIQMLAHLWNDYLSKESHFILVVCGSATSWITRKIINDPGGLHNRVTELIHLHPFSIGETHAFLQEKGFRPSVSDVAQIYMALGGIPFYLENIRKGESFSVAVERMCFSPQGLLKNEYQNLYQALFNQAEIHEAIVSALASSRHGKNHTEILKNAGLKASGSYRRAIEELLVSDFIVEQTPFNRKKKGSLFRLVDEFSIFYHRFIKQQKKYTPGIWQQLAESQSYKIWAGYAFESLCHKHIREIKNALGIAAVYTEISSLRVPASEEGDGFQIDLIIDRKDASINLCEIKFHNGPFTIDKAYYQQLLAKRQRFIEHTKTKKQVFLTFITNHGVVKNGYANEVVDAEVTLEELIIS